MLSRRTVADGQLTRSTDSTLASETHPWVWPTEIAEYFLCPWKVYYRRVLGIHLESSAPQAIGWFEHEAWRRFYSYIDPPKLTQLPEELDEVVSRSISESLEWALLGFEGFPYSLRSHVGRLQAILGAEVMRLQSKLQQNPTDIDYIFPALTEATLADPKLGLKGRVDLVYHTVSGLEPWDIKTGIPTAHLSESYILQVSTYGVMLESLWNREVKRGGIRYTWTGENYSFSVTPELKDKVLAIADEIRAMVLTKEQPKIRRLTLSHCGVCNYRSYCERAISTAQKAKAE